MLHLPESPACGAGASACLLVDGFDLASVEAFHHRLFTLSAIERADRVY